MTVARLGISVESASAQKGSVDLDALTRAAGRAETAETSRARANRQAEGATRSLTTATRALEQAEVGVARATTMATHNARNLSFQLIDIGQSIPLAFQSPIYALQNLGFQMAQIGQIYMGQGGMRQALRDSIAQVATFVRYVGPAAAAAGVLAAAFAGMAYEINATSDVTVSFGDVALASFQVVRDGISSTLMPAVEAIAPGFASVWDLVVQGTVAAGNSLINVMRIAAEGIASAIRMLPAVFKSAFAGAAASALQMLKGIVVGADAMISGIVHAFNEAFSTSIEPPTFLLDAADTINVIRTAAARAAKEGVGAMTGELERFAAKASEIAASDPLGQFFGLVSAQARANALGRQAGDAAGGGGSATGRAAKDAEEATLKFRGLKAATSDLNKEMSLGRDVTGGFLQTLNQGLRSGAGIWQSFADAAVNALDRITDKLLNDVLDALFQVNNAGGGGGGFFGKILGSIFGGAVGGIGGVPFASNFGGVPTFGGTTSASFQFANGGVVNGPTVFPMASGMGLMGEAGPEAIMPLKRGANGRLGVEANAGGAPKIHISVDQGVHVQLLNEAARQAAVLDQRAQADTLKRVPATAAAGFNQRPSLRR